jgi:S-(hydroxymethyl)glutathione dehydrogenase/alcohol dehydrogenase
MSSEFSRSRRNILKKGSAAVGGAAFAFQNNRAAAQQTGIQTGTMAGRKFRAFVLGLSPNIQDLRMLPLDENRVVIRTEACQVCYTITGQARQKYAVPEIPGHGGVGIVEAIGSKVRRVQVGDRVIVANTPYCGQCYMCISGRPDRCQMRPSGSTPVVPIAETSDGTKVVQHNNEGGFAELMIPYEWYCMPVFSTASSIELSMLGCVGACGLGTTFGIAPVEPASDVCVLGCGPVGLSAVQGARIKGASQIIAVEPIRARRELALKLGATIALDPNAEGKNLVAKVKNLCKGPTDRKFAGGRSWATNANGLSASIGPDFVIEAVGGDSAPPKAEAGPDPTGLLPLQQAWDMVSGTGHIVTVSVGQKGNFSVPGNQWANGEKNHHPGNMNGVSSLRDMHRFARLIETGQFNAKAMATATYPLERAQEAIQIVEDRTTIGAVLVFS